MKLLSAQTFKTHFEVTTFMQNSILENGVNVHISPSSDTTLDKIQFEYDVLVAQGQNHLSKNWGYTVSLNHKNTLSAAEKQYNLL
jgi:maltose phosphorylase